MRIFQGLAISPGVAIAPAFVLRTLDAAPVRRTLDADEVPGEEERLLRAVRAARDGLTEAAHQAGLSEAASSIAMSHREWLNDPTLLGEIRHTITHGRSCAEWAVTVVFRRWVEKFKALRDDFFRQRYVDLIDLEKRVLRHLAQAGEPVPPTPDRPAVLVAQDLTPSEAAAVDRQSIVALATEQGGVTSHTAIVAKSLGVPAVCALGQVADVVADGVVVVCDGENGRLVIDPDEKTLRSYREMQDRLVRRARHLKRIAELPAETPDGWPVGVMGNIEFPFEVERAIRNGADGIGLYRTEFLYAERNAIPDEETHLGAYRQALEVLQGRPLTIRTFDFGADKFAEEVGMPPERNPSLGLRSIRFSFARPELFRTQIRAILRASAEGPISMLLPMISSLTELRQARTMLEEVMEELRRERIPFDPALPVGVMVEIPSAAVSADLLAKEVDFFSIGTNDLTQYALAVDRGNERVANLFRPGNPGILRLLRTVLQEGERRRIRVTMCGEMASETPYTLLLLGLGLRYFSVTPAAVPELKRVVRAVTRHRAAAIARRALTLSTPEEVDEYLAQEAALLLQES